MAHIVELAEAEDGEGLLVLVDWIGFEEDGRMWEPIENMWWDARTFLRKSHGKCA